MNNTPLTTSYSGRRTVASSSRTGSVGMNSGLSKISTGEQLLAEGSKINAKVTDFVGRDLTLRLADGTTVEARTAQGTPLSIGQNAEFEVLRSDTEQLLLKLVNSSQANSESTVALQALDAAGLPHSEANVSLVNTLLENRLPVDSDSIKQLARQSAMFKGADVTTLAQLNKYGLPVTEATINQFNAYSSFKHQLLPQFESLSEGLGLLNTLADSGTEAAMADGLNEFLAEGQADASTENAAGLNDNIGMSATTSGLNAEGGNSTVTAANSQVAGSPAAENSNISADSNLVQDSDAAQGLNAAQNQNTAQASDIASETFEGTGTGIASDPDAGAAYTANSEATANTENALQELKDEISNLLKDIFSKTDSSFSDPEAQSAQNTLSGASAESLIQDAEGNEIPERWTITPEKLKEKGEIEKLYGRLSEDLDKISETLKKIKDQAQTDDSPAGKLLAKVSSQVQNLKDNIEFMSMLNRYFPYVQLPMKMNEKFTQGELSVYTRKSIKKTDGSASVLLHLDMENLGPTDIHLSLTGNYLTAKFYLSDDSVSSLFTDHISELTDKLEADGLNVSCEMLSREEAPDPVKDFLSTDEPTGMKRYKFDCRA